MQMNTMSPSSPSPPASVVSGEVLPGGSELLMALIIRKAVDFTLVYLKSSSAHLRDGTGS